MTNLMWAARNGSQACLGLVLPVSDTLAKDVYGMTALMYAAQGGHETCVRLLLPVSDEFAQDEKGQTASVWASNKSHKYLAQLINGYALAQSERTDIEVATSPGVPRGPSVRRV